VLFTIGVEALAEVELVVRRHRVALLLQRAVSLNEELLRNSFYELIDLAATVWCGRLATWDGQALPVVDRANEDVFASLGLWEIIHLEEDIAGILDVGEVEGWVDLLEHVGDLSVVGGVQAIWSHLPQLFALVLCCRKRLQVSHWCLEKL